MQNEKMFAAAKSSAPPKTTKSSISGVGDEAIFTVEPSSAKHVVLLLRALFSAMVEYGLDEIQRAFRGGRRDGGGFLIAILDGQIQRRPAFGVP